MRSPYIKRMPRSFPPPPAPAPSAFDMALGMSQIADIAKELKALKEKHIATIEEHTAKFEETLALKIAEHNAVIEKVNAIEPLQGPQGDMPVPGVHFPIPENGKDADEEAVVKKVLSQIRQPKDGSTPIIDHDAIAKKAAKLVKIPTLEKQKPIDHEEVANILIKKLEDGVIKLKPKHIDGFDNQFASLRNQVMRGGGDTIKAGTNITLVRNSDGTVSIYSTGGSGFTELTATETPDGSTTVFTFATATAQPSFIVSDNVWMKATAKSGAVNWTWNGGTKKATMTIPPNEDIFAVV